MNKQRESKFEVDLAGVDRYVAETTLTITDRYSGDNYCVRATLQNPGDQPFDTVSGMTGNAPVVTSSVKATRNLVAWKRVYIEMDRMYTAGGTFIGESVVNDGDTTILRLDSTLDFSIGQQVVVFSKEDSETTTVRNLAGHLLAVDRLSMTVPKFSGVRPADHTEMFPCDTSLLSAAYGLTPDGEEGGAFIEFRVLDVGDCGVPYYRYFPDDTIPEEYAGNWFNLLAYFDENVAYLLAADMGATGHLGSTYTNGLCIVYTGHENEVSGVGKTVVHELGHRMGLVEPVGKLNHIDSSEVSTYDHRKDAHCIMSYKASNGYFCIWSLLHGSSNDAHDSLREGMDK